MHNQIELIGNLGQDPRMAYTPGGTPVTNFPLAVNKTWTSQDGQRQSSTLWFDCTCWQKTAEIASQYLAKGRQVFILGEVTKPGHWTGNDGQINVVLKVNVQKLVFLGNADGNTNNSTASQQKSMTEEEVPF